MIALVDLAALREALTHLECSSRCNDAICADMQRDRLAVLNSIPLTTLGHNLATAGRLWVAEAERDLVNGGWVELRADGWRRFRDVNDYAGMCFLAEIECNYDADGDPAGFVWSRAGSWDSSTAPTLADAMAAAQAAAEAWARARAAELLGEVTP